MNLVVPEEEAVNRSAPFMLFTAKDALEPMELLIKSGNSVVAPAAPISTCESKSPVKMRLPVP